VEGLQELGESNFHVAILDLRLGDDRNGGISLAQQINKLYPRTRTILLTAYGSKETWTAARATGIDEVLDKPTPLWELNETARRLAGGTPDESAPSSDQAPFREERGHNGHEPPSR
jgi:DNA-binding NarL/FixJ family response regulator